MLLLPWLAMMRFALALRLAEGAEAGLAGALPARLRTEAWSPAMEAAALCPVQEGLRYRLFRMHLVALEAMRSVLNVRALCSRQEG